MSNTTNPALQELLGALQDAMDTRGVTFLQSEPKDLATVHGKTMKGEEYDFCMPVLEVDRRATADSPLALWFTKDEKAGKIALNYQLKVKPQFEGKQPFLLSNIQLTFCVLDSEGNISKPQIKVNPVLMQHPQQISGVVLLSLAEFSYLKDCFNEDALNGENHVYFSWSADVMWVPFEEMKAYAETTSSDNRKKFLRNKPVSGEVKAGLPLDAKKAYDGVSALLNWEHELIESGPDSYDIWFKDTMETNTYYFLPQIFRIKANPTTNAPIMRITFVRDEGANECDTTAYKVRLNFEMAPYYHPKAERDLYRVLKQRTAGRVKICNLKYGGYESATFKVQTDQGINIAYSQLGVQTLGEDEVKTNPDSSFRVALEGSIEAYNQIRKDLSESNIFIGNVSVTVKEGLDGKTKEILIPAYLDMKKLVGYNIGIKPIESTEKKISFPHEVDLTNHGKYPIEIWGCELSMMSEKKGVSRDVAHNLETDNNWPVVLASGETKRISLKQSDIQTLNKKNTFLGLRLRKYWTELICQPHSIRLPQEYIEGILDEVQDLATSKMEAWNVRVEPSPLDWSELPDVKSIEIQIRNEQFAVDEIITLKPNSGPTTVNMCGNLTAILRTQYSDFRTLQFRLRAALSDRVTPWSEYQENEGDVLYVFANYITDLLNKQNT